jgi:hypothetical protein
MIISQQEFSALFHEPTEVKQAPIGTFRYGSGEEPYSFEIWKKDLFAVQEFSIDPGILCYLDESCVNTGVIFVSHIAVANNMLEIVRKIDNDQSLRHITNCYPYIGICRLPNMPDSQLDSLERELRQFQLSVERIKRSHMLLPITAKHRGF